MAMTARYFGAREAGEFALVLAITAPVFVVLDLGLRTLYLSRTPHPPYRDLLSLRIRATTIALLISFLFATVRSSMTFVIIAVAVAKSADLFVELAIGPLQLVDRLLRATALTLAAGSIIVAAYFFTSNRGFQTALTISLFTGAAILSAGALTLGSVASHAVERLAPRCSAPGLTRDGLALGFGNGIVSLAYSVPQLVLAFFYNTVVSGRFAVMLYVVVAGEMVMNAVSQAVLPSVTLLRRQHGARGTASWANHWMRRGTSYALPAACAAVGVAAGLVPLVMGQVYRITFVEGALLVAMLTLLPALFVGSVALQALNRYNATATISVTTLIVVLCAALIMVPPFGVAGALGAALTGTLVRILLARRIWMRPAVNEKGEVLEWKS